MPTDTFGMRLRAVRAELGMTAQDFAKKCGLDRGQLGAWERGTMPRDLAGVVLAVSDATGVDRDWLAFGNTRRYCPTHNDIIDLRDPDPSDAFGDARSPIVYDLAA